jgi:FkbM family methyltransferase
MNRKAHNDCVSPITDKYDQEMNSLTIRLRSFSRNIGLIGLINRFRAARPYEDRFHKAIEAALRPDDTVWDVGANVGFYTEIFCNAVGPQGSVVAFEPFPESIAEIKRRFPDCSWLHIENVALGEKDATGHLALSDSSTTHHLTSEASEAESIPVEVIRGDAIYERRGAPHLIKIDVEGFEEEVLKGLSRTLSSPELRGVFVEVHFRSLSERGQADAPIRIVKMLRSKGFRVTWLDPSHLQAIRG